MRRTSIKAGIAALICVVLYILSIGLAENYHRGLDLIVFSGGHGRPWNIWDYVELGLLVLAAAFTAVALMFAQKDD